MTIEDIKEVTEAAKDKLKENGDVYSEHILAYISHLESQIDQLSNDNHVLKTSFITQQEMIEKLKCCQNCKHSIGSVEWKIECPIGDLESWDGLKCKHWELEE